MLRALKWIVGLAVVLVSLVVVAVTGVLFFLDPNDYREQIADKVQEQTGRELRIDGEIHFSFFPWLGLELGQLELGNAPGFADEPFAGIRRADLKIKILPLLRMQAEVDTIVLHGLTLNLHRLADGRSNWDDLAGEPASQADEPDPGREPHAGGRSPEAMLEGLAIGGIEILDANIRWQDDSVDQLAQLRQFNLRTGEISLHRPIPLQLSAQVSLNEPALQAEIDLSTRIALNLSDERYQLDKTRLTLDLRSALIPGEQLKLSLATDLEVDLQQETAAIKGLQLQALGIELSADLHAQRILAEAAATGRFELLIKDTAALADLVELPDGMSPRALQGTRLAGEVALDLAEQRLDVHQFSLSSLGMELGLQLAIAQLLEEPAIRGQLRSNEFVPRQVMEKLGMELPEMADPNTLILASISTDFEAGTDRFSLNELRVQLDQSHLGGQLSVQRFEAPVIRYDLTLDEIDVDRYLPPASDAEDAEQADTAEAEPIDLPLELLRSLDINGTFRIGNAKVMNLRSDNVLKTLHAENGLFRVHPLSAELYQGSYHGNLHFDVRQDTPRLGMDEHLRGVQAGPLLKDFLGEDYADGRVHLAVKMTAEGIEPAQILPTLNGNGSVHFEDGQIKGINIGQLLRQGYAAYKRQEPPAEELRQTDFSSLHGNFTVRNGVLNTDDLAVRSPVFRVAGRGDVDLVRERLNLRLDTTVTSDLGDGGEMRGVTIPITIRGSFEDPSFGVDVAGVLRARLGADLDAAKREAQQRLRDEQQRLEADAQRRADEEERHMRQRLEAEQAEARQRADEEERRLQQRLDEESKKTERELQDRLRDRLRR